MLVDISPSVLLRLFGLLAGGYEVGRLGIENVRGWLFMCDVKIPRPLVYEAYSRNIP